MADDLNLRVPPELASSLSWLATAEDSVFDGGLDVFQQPLYERVRIFQALSELPEWDPENAGGVLEIL